MNRPTQYFFELWTRPEIVVVDNFLTFFRRVQRFENYIRKALIPLPDFRRVISIATILAHNRALDGMDVGDPVEFLRVRLAEPCCRRRVNGCVELDPAAVEEGFPQRVPGQRPTAFAAP